MSEEIEILEKKISYKDKYKRYINRENNFLLSRLVDSKFEERVLIIKQTHITFKILSVEIEFL